MRLAPIALCVAGTLAPSLDAAAARYSTLSGLAPLIIAAARR